MYVQERYESMGNQFGHEGIEDQQLDRAQRENGQSRPPDGRQASPQANGEDHRAVNGPQVGHGQVLGVDCGLHLVPDIDKRPLKLGGATNLGGANVEVMDDLLVQGPQGNKVGQHHQYHERVALVADQMGRFPSEPPGQDGQHGHDQRAGQELGVQNWRESHASQTHRDGVDGDQLQNRQTQQRQAGPPQGRPASP